MAVAIAALAKRHRVATGFQHSLHGYDFFA
jgi:hypothetical protein